MAWETLDITPTAYEIDTSSQALPPETMSRVSNVDFYGGRARTLSDLSSVATPTTTPVALQYYADSTSKLLAYGGSTGVYAWTPTNTQANLTPSSGLTGSTYWDMTNIGPYLVVTNNKTGEQPHAITAASSITSGNLQVLTGWTSSWQTKVIKTHRNVLWAGNMTEANVRYPNRVRWSSSAITNTLPQTWTAASSNDAGSNDLELTDGVTDMAAVGDTMFIGGPGGVWAARWVGGAYVYNFSQLLSNSGPRGLRAMESMGDSVAVLTNTDLLVLTESSLQSIVVGKMTNLIKSFKSAELLYVAAKRQLYAFYSLENETGYQHCLIWDRDTNTFGHRDFANTPLTATGWAINPVPETPRTWASMTNTWDQETKNWEAPNENIIRYFGAGAAGILTENNTTYNWSIQKDLIPSPDGEELRIRSLELGVDAEEGGEISIRIGSSTYAGQNITWGPTKTYIVGSGNIRHDDLRQGRYFSFVISGTSNCRINAIRLYYKVRKVKP